MPSLQSSEPDAIATGSVSQENWQHPVDHLLSAKQDDELNQSEQSECDSFQHAGQKNESSKLEKDIDRKTLNGTAYRIFKLLEWLIESPLSLEEMNARLINDP